MVVPFNLQINHNQPVNTIHYWLAVRRRHVSKWSMQRIRPLWPLVLNISKDAHQLNVLF